MSDERSRLPIAVFDSGIGGLTVLHELLVSLPEEDYLYLGDTAGFPYGSKAGEWLRPPVGVAGPVPARPRGEAARRRVQFGDRRRRRGRPPRGGGLRRRGSDRRR